MRARTHERPQVKEFSSCAFNPTGECCVVGNFNRFFVFVRNARAGVWEEAGDKVVENYYTVSALAWKPVRLVALLLPALPLPPPGRQR